MSPVTGNAVVIWVTGSLTLGGVENLAGHEENLQFFVTSSNDVNINASGGELFGMIYAPLSHVNVDRTTIFGSLVGSTVTLNSGAAVHFDTSPAACSVVE